MIEFIEQNIPAKDQQLERYRLIECIGTGGMGWVFRAVDTNLQEYQLALKVFYPHLVQQLDSQQFEAEALIARRLTHPNIVQVYNYHRLKDDVVVMSMELMPGLTLANPQEQESNWSVDKKIVLLFEIASGLAFAHRSGVLHRDIKPDNVLLSSTGQAKIADFGIAQLLGDNAQLGAQKFVGTPHYMSPEQFSGTVLRPSSDVYSFGILAYYLIHGTVPFTAKTLFELAEKHCNEKLPLQTGELKQYPDWIRELLECCCEKMPENRFRSMDETLAFIASESNYAIEQTEKASGQNFAQEAKESKELRYVSEEIKPMVRASLKTMYIISSLSGILAVTMDDIGYRITFAILITITLSLHCRPSIRVATTFFQIAFVILALVVFNPYSRSVAGVALLAIEKHTGIESPWLKGLMGYDMTFSDPSTLIEVDRGNHDLRLLARSPFDLNIRGRRNETVLHNIAGPVHLGQTRQIIDRIRDINAQDNKGKTALLQALITGSDDYVGLLLRKGANPNIADNKGVYPLPYATRYNNALLVKKLLCHGAQTNLPFSKSENVLPLAIAITQQSSDKLACLIQHGAMRSLDVEQRIAMKQLAEAMNPAGQYYSLVRTLVEMGLQDAKMRPAKSFTTQLKERGIAANCSCNARR